MAMMTDKDLRTIPTPLLRAMRDLCPRVNDGVSSVTFSTGGKRVTLTYASRLKAEAELARRREEAPTSATRD